MENCWGVLGLLKNPIVWSWIETLSHLDFSGQISGKVWQDAKFVRCALPTMSNTFVSFTLGCELHERPRIDLAFNVFEL